MTGPDQSIEEILASIKRIIVEEEAPATPPPAMAEVATDDVLELTRPLPATGPAHSTAPPTAGLVSPGPADASRQALAYLSSLKLKAGDPADDTLSALVRELLRPMLQAWLDAELPGIVERAVVREIARLGGPRE